MIKHKGSLSEYSYDQIRASGYPYAQKRIYEALLKLSPEQLNFELEQIPEERSFCMSGIDTETWEIIGHVMTELMENEELVLTMDDLKLCYSRFRELMFLSAAVEQGLMQAVTTDKGTEYFYTLETPETPTRPQVEQKVYIARRTQPHRKYGRCTR